VIEFSTMPRDLFDPTPEQQMVVLIDQTALRKAERLIESCEYCNEEGAGYTTLLRVLRYWWILTSPLSRLNRLFAHEVLAKDR
jgi:hypothetical protein